jgi:hypothetical protein
MESLAASLDLQLDGSSRLAGVLVFRL